MVTRRTRGSPASSKSWKIGHSRRNLTAVLGLSPPQFTEGPMAEGSSISTGQKALIGAGVAVAFGAAGFLAARRSPDVHDDGENISEAPDHTWRRKTGQYEEGLVG